MCYNRAFFLVTCPINYPQNPGFRAFECRIKSIIGIAGILFLLRMTEEQSLLTLLLLVMLVATTVGCLEVAWDATQTNYTTLTSYLGLTSKEVRIPWSMERILNFLFMEQNSDRMNISPQLSILYCDSFALDASSSTSFDSSCFSEYCKMDFSYGTTIKGGAVMASAKQCEYVDLNN